jgi:polynucleotide 5'-kinase involved in rRNA processing
LNSTKRGQWEILETTFMSHAKPRSSAIYLYNYDPDNPVYFDGLELKEIAQ